MARAVATSMDATAYHLGTKLPLKKRNSLGSSLPYLRPRLCTPSIVTSIKHFSESRRFSSLWIKATPSEETSSSVEVNKIFTNLKEKWDALENKSTVFLYGSGAIVAVWLSSLVVGSLDSVPLVPKIMELVGLGYTGWFVYRYLLFKSSRQELAMEIDSLKKKISGSE